ADRTQLVAQFNQTLVEKLRQRLPALAQHLAVGDEAGALEGEDETLRRHGAPLAEAGGRLQAIEGGVDLDRTDRAGGVFQLPLLRQAFGIERAAAPRRIGPSADARADRHAVAPRPRRWIAAQHRLANITFEKPAKAACDGEVIPAGSHGIR